MDGISTQFFAEGNTSDLSFNGARGCSTAPAASHGPIWLKDPPCIPPSHPLPLPRHSFTLPLHPPPLTLPLHTPLHTPPPFGTRGGAGRVLGRWLKSFGTTRLKDLFFYLSGRPRRPSITLRAVVVGGIVGADGGPAINYCISILSDGPRNPP